ncbi:MAG: TolC family protein [Planctomycetes bacterium]|nr:TolC family protein [Planctomycetota bacterium]
MESAVSPALSLFLVVALALAGCRADPERYGLAELGVSRQQVHEIAPLELPQAEPNEPAPEPNQPPAEKIALSLEESRALALENNLQLKTALINPALAATQVSEEEARFESTFFARTNLLKSDQPVGTVGLIPGTNTPFPTIAASQVERLQSDLGVQVPLRTGGTLTFDLADTRTEDLLQDRPFNPSFGNSASVSVSQPLLRNAGRRFNLHPIRVASYQRDITDARTRLDVITVLGALDQVYWRLYAARKELEVRQQQHELAQAQLERARRLVEAGQRAQVEIIRAEAGVAQQLEAIIIAENTLRDRERELKRVIHRARLPVESPTVVVPTTEPDPVRYELDRPQLVRQAMDARMELLELELLLLQDDSTIDAARNQTLPLVTLEYAYSIAGTGESRSESFDMVAESDFVNHSLGLQASIPLGNDGAKSRLRRAIYTRRQRLATRANREDLVRQEVLSAADQVEANWQRILAARQNTVLNGRLYEAERRQFEQGIRTSTDVLDAQIKFADAQSAEIRALADYQISLVNIAVSTGTLLGSAKVRWEPIVPPADSE